MMKFAEVKAWARLILIVAMIIAGMLVVVMNRNNQTDLWFFHDFEDVAVLWLIAITAVVSIIGWRIILGVRGAYVELRKARMMKDQTQAGYNNDRS